MPQDTFLNVDDTNHDTNTVLATYTWPDYRVANAIIMKFDLAALPGGAIVERAILRAALMQSDAAADTYTVAAHKLTKNADTAKATGLTTDGVTPWTANACCHDAVPLAQADISGAYDAPALDTTPGMKTWDITDMVREWLADPATNFGVLLNSDGSKPKDRHRFFASAEHPDATLRPYLEVTVAARDVTPPSIAITTPAAGASVSNVVSVTADAADDVGVAGVRFHIDGTPFGADVTTYPYAIDWDTTTVSDGLHTLTAVARDTSGNSATATPVTVVLDNGLLFLPVEDTFLHLNATNYSRQTTLKTYTWPDNKVANAIVLRADLSPLPPRSVVEDATLFLALVQSDSTSTATYTIGAHKLLKNPVMTSVTGYTVDGVTPWTPINCCYGRVPLAQGDITARYTSRSINKTKGLKSWTITTMVQEWLANPAGNFGLLLNADTTKSRDRYRTFASTEHADPALRPFVRIKYAPPPPDTTPPTVSMTAPAPGTYLSGIVSLSASATDDVAVAGVQFEINGAPAGGEVTTAPYILNWDTAAIADGEYTVSARAHDGAGNTAGANAVRVRKDRTPPAVAIAFPAGGSVSGTINVTASASDTVGVVGVQFRIDGGNLGAERIAAPYTVSWDTKGATNGSHTLTAVARDAAGNTATSAAVALTVANTVTAPGSGIAAGYPGDVGIEGNPNVIFVERFDESSLGGLFSRWTDILNGSAMSFTTDAPAGSPIGRSLNIPWSSAATGGHLYRQLTPGVDDTLFVRYYVKYPTNGDYSHHGIWMGGYNPPLAWPNPQAGVRPSGSDRFSAAAEQNTLTARFDHYDYWMGMRQSNDGSYWGNLLLNNPNVQAKAGQWMCVEQMVKLNTPAGASNGEHAIWLDGVKVSHLGQGYPNGIWSGGIFTQDPGGSPFPGFQWRNTTSLNLNYLWLQVYATAGSGGFKYAHVVAAKSYIGCLASGGGSSDTTAPAVSITAPSGGATLSATIAVSANASDNVGVAGVQFRLDGNTLGAEDTTAPYSVSLNTTTLPNGPHVLTAVARDATGNTATSASVTANVSNVTTPSWPNNPAGFSTRNDQPWNLLTGSGWNYLRRTASKASDIIADALAPFSPLNVLRMIFTTDMARDTEPGVHWLGLSNVKEVYTGWWMKVSPNWTCSPAGCGKVSFLFTNGAGQVYTGLYHTGNQAAPYFIGVNTEWSPYGQRIWQPNVTTTHVNPGEWHRVEFYYRWETTPGVSGDGIIRWWVDGVLNGNHTNVSYPSSAFIELQYAPTLQNPPLAEQYMYFDHTFVSTPP